ncbi:hypothetical protein TNCV_2430931 [Trichonephila clavipes]|nr:hypothetical protein TNCV_2430931 [Trichonephila clavipes]
MDQRVLFMSKLNEMKMINEKIEMEQENKWKIKEVEWKAENGAFKIKLENVLVENKTWETKAQEWKIEKDELKTENRTLKNKLQSRAAVDKILKRMIRSNRKLRKTNPFRFKRPRPAIVQASLDMADDLVHVAPVRLTNPMISLPKSGEFVKEDARFFKCRLEYQANSSVMMRK